MPFGGMNLYLEGGEVKAADGKVEGRVLFTKESGSHQASDFTELRWRGSTADVQLKSHVHRTGSGHMSHTSRGTREAENACRETLRRFMVPGKINHHSWPD